MELRRQRGVIQRKYEDQVHEAAQAEADTAEGCRRQGAADRPRGNRASDGVPAPRRGAGAHDSDAGRRGLAGRGGAAGGAEEADRAKVGRALRRPRASRPERCTSKRAAPAFFPRSWRHTWSSSPASCLKTRSRGQDPGVHRRVERDRASVQLDHEVVRESLERRRQPLGSPPSALDRCPQGRSMTSTNLRWVVLSACGPRRQMHGSPCITGRGRDWLARAARRCVA